MLLNSKEKTVYRRSKQFLLLREQLLKENDNRCQCCGVKKPKKLLQCHHIDELKYREEDEKLFLRLVCCECHKFIERKIRVIQNKKNKVPLSLLQFLSPFSVVAEKELQSRLKEENFNEKI